METITVAEKEIPLKAIERLEQVIYANMWIKDKKVLRKMAVQQIYDATVAIETAGGKVIWE